MLAIKFGFLNRVVLLSEQEFRNVYCVEWVERVGVLLPKKNVWEIA